VDTDKIGYEAEMEAVYEIAHNATQKQSKGQHTRSGSWGKVIEKYQDNDRTSYAKGDENLGVIGKQTQNGTSIFNVNQIKKAWQQHYSICWRQIDSDPQLAQLVKSNHQSSDNQK
jgi:hypothetical protein